MLLTQHVNNVNISVTFYDTAEIVAKWLVFHAMGYGLDSRTE